MNQIVSILLLSIAIAGCAGTGARSSNSTQVDAIIHRFDFNQAVTALDAGRNALETGNLDVAIAELQKGLALWPAHQLGWAMLSHAYGQKGDAEGVLYADYFSARIEWANSLNGSTAALAFNNIALIHAETPYADLRIPETAALLSNFYRQGQSRINRAASSR